MATAGKRYKAEQIVNMLREIDGLRANGKSLREDYKRSFKIRSVDCSFWHEAELRFLQ